MKKLFLFTAIAASLMLWTGCDEKPEPEISQPAIVLQDIPDNQLTFPAEGAQATIRYTIENPADGGKVYAEANQDWIADINSDTEGTVTFDVLENEETESRNAIITLTYEWAEGSVQAQINAIQSERTVFFDFQVPEENIKATSARVIISCLDTSLFWYDGLVLSSEIAEDPNFAETKRQEFLELTEELIALLGCDLTDLLYPGDFIDDWTWTRLDMNSAYTPFAFGLDENGEFTTDFHYGPEFTTKDDQPTGAYAEGHINHYWHIDDLIEYNPEYAKYVSDEPLFAAMDITYNEEAAGAYCIVWIGDITTEDTEEEIYQNTLAEANLVSKGDPAPLLFMNYDECSTICVIAVDADGNYGDMHMEVITLTEEGTCHDYALFDKYFNAITGTSASAATIRPRVNIPERPVPEGSSLLKDRIMRRHLR